MSAASELSAATANAVPWSCANRALAAHEPNGMDPAWFPSLVG
jgi:hypothetical protein